MLQGEFYREQIVNIMLQSDDKKHYGVFVRYVVR
jgi:hypothetical protein